LTPQFSVADMGRVTPNMEGVDLVARLAAGHMALFAGHMAGCVAPPEVMLTIARLAAGHIADCVASLEFMLTVDSSNFLDKASTRLLPYFLSLFCIL
jgi:hypothetical protein